MATEVKIPALGESISSGILAQWHVKSGDYVESGQALFDLETDKITSEATAESSGVITCLAEEGDEVEIGAVVATIEPAEKPAETASPADSTAAPAKAPPPPPEEAPAVTPAAKGVHPPSVRRIARESGVDPDTVSGSGKAGRVTKADMLEATQATEAAPPPEVAEVPESPAPSVEGAVVRKKMTPLRKTIARRLVEAQQTTAMLTTFNEVDMSAVMQLRKRHQEAFIEKHGVKLGFMSFFTKAVVQALQAVPSVKGQIDGDEILTFSQDDIGIAVSTPKGLMVPVVRNCREKSFAEVEKEILYFAGKAREGKITMDDLSGGVFTITNGGIFGSMLSTPILNSPQSAILGMHTIQQRPVAIDGEVVIRPMMYLALSYDHRLVDGREAVTFLVTVKRAIEDPSSLLFDL